MHTGIHVATVQQQRSIGEQQFLGFAGRGDAERGNSGIGNRVGIMCEKYLLSQRKGRG
jgi:hypothetical protein